MRTYRSRISKVKRKTYDNKVGKVMHEFKAGTLNSGSRKGPIVKNRSQAIAIALSVGKKAVRSHTRKTRKGNTTVRSYRRK